MSPTPDRAPASSTPTATLPPRNLPSLEDEPRPSPDRPPSTPPPATMNPGEWEMGPDPARAGLLARLRMPGRGEPRTSSWGGDDDDGPDEPRRAPTRGKDRPDAALVAKTLGQLLVVLAGLGAWLASKSGRELRPPTEAERADVAEPVAAILVRRVGAAFLTEDLVDGVRAAAGVTAYVQTAPLHRVRDEPRDENLNPVLPDGYEEP